MKKITVFTYGVGCYLLFLLTFLYAIGFVGNILVPKSIDTGIEVPLIQAILINLVLLNIFAVQHSVMARPAFKKMWTKIVPEPAERSTYVLLSSLALILLFYFWQPMGAVIWHVEGEVGQMLLYGGFAFGWLLVLVATFLINHFDLFGLRQVYLYLKDVEYFQLPFATPGPYKLIRHPLYLGWFFAFWCTPVMTLGHLLFSIVTTAYILVAIQFEEKDLQTSLGQRYKDYRQLVPMIIPFMKPRNVEGLKKKDVLT